MFLSFNKPLTGLLFRTEADKIKEELLIEDLENLIQQWENILKVSEGSNPPTLIKEMMISLSRF